MAMSKSRKSLDKKTARVLHALYHLNKDQRKTVLKAANRRVIKGICECALNTLSGNVPLSPVEKKKLSKYKAVLRKLSKKDSASWKTKRRLIVQKGNGFLAALLAPVIGTILSALIPSRS